jgi:energy-coupling factor transport system ATP-binding protein
MNAVAEHCTRLAVFSNGEIIAHGTPKQVFSDAEKLLNIGLELPLTARLTVALNGAQTGFDNDFTTKNFVDTVANKLGGKR